MLNTLGYYMHSGGHGTVPSDWPNEVDLSANAPVPSDPASHTTARLLTATRIRRMKLALRGTMPRHVMTYAPA